MKVHLLRKRNVFASNCYILISGGEFSVIDPSLSYERAVEDVPEILNLSPGFILLTHAHIDHIFEIESYVRLGMKVLVDSSDADKLADRMKNAAYLFGENLVGYTGAFETLGDAVHLQNDTLRIIRTPGHTSGSVCYLCENMIFTGDTVFAEGYGRYDLYSGNGGELFKSLRLIFSLDESIEVYPGHGQLSDIRSIKLNFDY